MAHVMAWLAVDCCGDLCSAQHCRSAVQCGAVRLRLRLRQVSVVNSGKRKPYLAGLAASAATHAKVRLLRLS